MMMLYRPRPISRSLNGGNLITHLPCSGDASNGRLNLIGELNNLNSDLLDGGDSDSESAYRFVNYHASKGVAVPEIAYVCSFPIPSDSSKT